MIFYYAFSPNISISSVPFVRCHQSSGRSVWRVSEDTSPEWNSQNCKHKFQLLRSFAKALPGSDLGTGNRRRSWTIRAVKMTWSFRAFRLIFIRIPSEYWWSRRIHRGWQAVLIDNKLVIFWMDKSGWSVNPWYVSKCFAFFQGALWHIYAAEDADKIRDCLRAVSVSFLSSKSTTCCGQKKKKRNCCMFCYAVSHRL